MGAKITSVGEPSNQRLASRHKGITKMGSNLDQSVVKRWPQKG